ncbi:hypothetical protein MPSEU_000315000 [Mayamaea pseudoterrestris]|nr:hypothetical protein MPSEU_000315000 [Mayamaea pseudoterrestris]
MSVLRDWILMPTMSPLMNNICVSQLHLILYKIAFVRLSQRRSNSRPYKMHHVSRELLQILSGASTVMLWPLYDTSDDWSWRLNVILPCVVAARLSYKGYFVASSDDVEVQLVSRSSSPSELLFGPLHFALILVWLGLYEFRTLHSAIIVAAVGIGDALAPILGHWCGRHSYQSPLAARKTMEGSLCGVFLGTVTGSYLFLYANSLPLPPLRIVLVYGFLAALLEGTAWKGMDNMVVAVVMHLAINKIQDWMPA